jgi:hypothetical protein
MVYNLTEHMKVRCETLSKLLESLDSIREAVAVKVALFSDMDRVEGDRMGKMIRQKLDAQDEEWERVKEEMKKEGKK